MRGRKERTPEKLAALCRSIELAGGNITHACQENGIGRTTIWQWCQDDPEAKKQIDAAVDRGADVLEEECRRRAFHGCPEPVFYQGVQCGVVQKYSDTLAIFLLKAVRPDKFRERVGVDFGTATDQQIQDAIFKLPDDKILALASRIRKASGE